MKKMKRLIVSILSLCIMLSCGMFAGCNKNNDDCNHENVIVCDNCGEVVLGNEYFVNYLKSSWSSMGKNKGFKLELDGTAVIPNESDGGGIYYMDENGEPVFAPVEKTEMVIENTELFIGFDENSMLYLDGDAELVINMYNQNVVNCVTKYEISNAKLEGTVFSSVNKVSTTYPNLSEELQAINNVSGEENDFNVDLADAAEGEDGVQPEMVFTQIVPMVIESYEDIILPFATGIIDANKNEINHAVATAIDSMFAVQKVGGNYEFTMDKLGYNIKQVNVMLDTDISVVFDQIFGAGEYDKLPQTINALLDYKVSDILDMLAEKGVTVDGIIDVADKIVKKITGDETATLELYLSEMAGSEVNIKGYIDLIKDNTLKEVIKTFAGVTDQDIVAALDEFAAVLAEYKDKSLYEIMEVDAQTKTMISTAVTAVANFLDEAVSVQMVLDDKGNIVSAKCGLTLDATKPATVAFINWLNGVGVDETVNGILTEMTVNVNAKVSVAAFPTA